jgi:hypothetical protein
MEKKKSGFPECLAAALGGEGFYKNQRNFFPECLGQALGEEGFLKKMKCLPRVLHSEKRVLKKIQISSPSVALREEFFSKTNGGWHRRRQIFPECSRFGTRGRPLPRERLR